jgi:hypothetical protein
MAPFLQDGFNLCPEVREKRGCIFIAVVPDSFSGVLMVVFDTRPCARTAVFTDCVRIVETKQPFAVFIVQCQRVAQSVWPLRRNRNLLYDDFDPTFASRIDNKTFAVEQQERIEAMIAICQLSMLSSDHNPVACGLRECGISTSSLI